ncbi:unnamed protein product [Prorocentrum cordatum]|uniref:Semialdehyde dehydrogenase NAD-binding domain-containing protein n=1 Tax=Prorocentrum cordatum TaxID=2364126 RepID=A0ABN9RMS4_9DINO|nr:unnamed protein product [Polarella glacialis]
MPAITEKWNLKLALLVFVTDLVLQMATDVGYPCRRGPASAAALSGHLSDEVAERLTAHPEIEILSLPSELRKDEAARRDALRSADAAVLCLPDDAAIAAVELCGDADTVIVDASTAHRIADGWVYGFAELSPGQAEAIASSKRIANPGCYPTALSFL